MLARPGTEMKSEYITIHRHLPESVRPEAHLPETFFLEWTFAQIPFSRMTFSPKLLCGSNRPLPEKNFPNDIDLKCYRARRSLLIAFDIALRSYS